MRFSDDTQSDPPEPPADPLIAHESTDGDKLIFREADNVTEPTMEWIRVAPEDLLPVEQ